MYAQCPECLTFFHLKPSHLKAANGRVRCSRCKAVFNALETLRDELTPEEIAAVKAARRREPKPDAPLLNEEYAGDLFDGLEYTKNAELGLGAAESIPDDRSDRRDADEKDALIRASGPAIERELQSDQLTAPVREFPDFRPRHSRRSRSPLAGIGVFILLLALLAQLVHWQRALVLEHELAGPWLKEFYSLIDFDIAAPADLSALKVSRTEVSSHPDHPRALHLTAMLENRSENTQPWPDLRVDLQDRFGDTVGARYFTPGEYLRDPAPASRAMTAGGRYAVALSILDPGNEAVGFQVEPCFASVDGDERRHTCATHLYTR